jgi:AcrR family transcriptional regulator
MGSIECPEFNTQEDAGLSKSLWSGNRPKSDEEAKNRLCEAALECLMRHGFEKTTMSDIAKEAGIARPTLYKHFKTKTEILFTAIDLQAYSFAHAVADYARQFATIEERIVETIIYVVIELPKHRYLSLVLKSGFNEVLSTRAFSDEATQIFSKITSAPLVEIRPDLKDQEVELSEIMSRFAISLIQFPGKYSNDHDELERLIRRRLLPGLLGVPAKIDCIGKTS